MVSSCGAVLCKFWLEIVGFPWVFSTFLPVPIGDSGLQADVGTRARDTGSRKSPKSYHQVLCGVLKSQSVSFLRLSGTFNSCFMHFI